MHRDLAARNILITASNEPMVRRRKRKEEKEKKKKKKKEKKQRTKVRVFFFLFLIAKNNDNVFQVADFGLSKKVDKLSQVKKYVPSF